MSTRFAISIPQFIVEGTFDPARDRGAGDRHDASPGPDRDHDIRRRLHRAHRPGLHDAGQPPKKGSRSHANGGPDWLADQLAAVGLTVEHHAADQHRLWSTVARRPATVASFVRAPGGGPE